MCEESGRKVTGFSDDAVAALQRHRWPGNVRELQNVVERAVLLGKGSCIVPDDLPATLSAAAPVMLNSAAASGSLKIALANPERQIILDMLERHHRNRHATAETLGVTARRSTKDDASGWKSRDTLISRLRAIPLAV